MNNQVNEEPKKPKKQRNAKVIKTAVLTTVMGLMASAIVGLSVSLYFADKSVKTHETYQKQMDAVYFRSYYDLMDGAKDLGVTLKKLSVSASPAMQQSLLYEVWTTASLAEANLGMFDGRDDGLMKAQKFINQLGDYSHALAIRVADGLPLTAEEKGTLNKLAAVATALERALDGVGAQESGKLFVGDNGMLEGFASAFGEFAEPSFEYPEMIYDGPFSDALEVRQPEALAGEDISLEQGRQLIQKYFDEYKVEGIGYLELGNGHIPTLNFSLTLDGSPAFVQLSKKGGRLVSFTVAKPFASETAASNTASTTAVERAIAFAEKVGYGKLDCVWSTSKDGESVVNLAPEQDGAILYPDLIKVKVDEASGKVSGFDATHYIFNHKRRELPKPQVSLEDAEDKLSIPPVSEGRLALIPLREAKEVLTYEFECESGGTYFVYIDAISGEEANILYVLDDGDGPKTI